MKRKMVMIYLFLISALVLYGCSNININSNAAANNGNLQQAPDFSLTTIEGKIVKLSDFRGKYVLFASMATWCTPCQIEANNVKRAQENFQNLPLVVMQIDVDPKETKQDLIRFRKEYGKEDWIMGFDDKTIVRLYDIRSFDTTLLIDPNGKIIYRDNGFPMDTKTLEDLIIKGE